MPDQFVMLEQFPDWIWLVLLVCVGAVFWALRPPKLPWRFHARVTYVCDGDSVWVRTWYGRRVKQRLLGIDAPESKQEFGEESQATLDRLIGGKRVDVVAVDRDIYGHYVSGIWCKGDDVCLRMIEEGMAWPYFRFMKQLTAEQRLAYRQAFEVAKRERHGLWRASNPETPWEWRRKHRSLWARFMLWLRRLLGII